MILTWNAFALILLNNNSVEIRKQSFVFAGILVSKTCSNFIIDDIRILLFTYQLQQQIKKNLRLMNIFMMHQIKVILWKISNKGAQNCDSYLCRHSNISFTTQYKVNVYTLDARKGNCNHATSFKIYYISCQSFVINVMYSTWDEITAHNHLVTI